MLFSSKATIQQVLARLRPDEAINLTPTDEDDLWNLYNLITPTDIVRALTTRKVNLDTEGASEGAKSLGSKRVTLKLTIQVTHIDFDPIANELRLGGLVTEENDWVPLGKRHTLSIKDNVALSIAKGGAGWDSVAKEALHDAVTGDKHAAIPAVIMQHGRAQLLLIRSSRTLTLAKVESRVPRKEASADAVGKATDKFHEKILQSMKTNFAFLQPDSAASPAGALPMADFLFVSPGFWATAFRNYIHAVAVRTSDRKLHTLVNKAIIVHSATGLGHGISSILENPKVKSMMGKMRFSTDQEAMDRFSATLKKDDNRAWYGKKPVEKAIEHAAIGPGRGELLISDHLFRSKHLATRIKYVKLVDTVQAAGGKVTIISSEHPSGEQLKLLGEIAAILTFPLEDLDDDEDGDDDDEDSDSDELQKQSDSDDVGDFVV